jgi:hypothetical protein
LKEYLFILVLLSFFFLTYTPLYSSGELLFPGGRSSGMGGAYTAVSNDLEAIGYNPAGLSNVSNTNIFFASKQLFNISELKHHVLSVGYGNRNLGGLAFMYEEVGYSLHKEKTYSFGYGKAINRFLNLGFNLKLYDVDINGYGSDKTVGLDAGYLTRVYNKVYFGIYLKNINNPQIGSTHKSDINQSFTSGFSYVGDALVVSLDITKETDYTTQFRYGIEYSFLEYFSARYGFNNEPKRHFIGLGVTYNDVSLFWSMFTHEYLDTTNQFGLAYKF